MVVQCGSGAVCVSCDEVTDCVKVSTQTGNQLSRTGGALFVPSPARTIVHAGQGINVGGDPTGGYTIAARPSTDGNNAVAFGTDNGLFVPQCTPSGVSSATDTPTVDLDVAAGVLSGAARISADAGNIVTAHDDGLFVPVAGGTPAVLISGDAGNDLRTGAGDGLLWAPACTPPAAAGDGLIFDNTTGYAVGAGPGIAVAADSVAARLSTDAGNAATFGGDGGLYVPSGTCPINGVASTPSVQMLLASGTATGNVKRSADAGNALELRGNGLWTPAAAVTAPSTLISAQAGNVLALGSDSKLFVPTPPTRPLAGQALTDDGTNFNVAVGSGLQFTGTAPNDVIAAKISADAGNLVKIGTDSGLYAPAGNMTAAFNQITVAAPPNRAVPANNTQVSLPIPGATVTDLSGGRITYQTAAGSGNWLLSRAMHVQVDVSMALTEDVHASVEVYIGVNALGIQGGLLRARTTLSYSWRVPVSFSGVFTSSAQVVMTLQVTNIASLAAFNLIISDVAVNVTWLADA